MVEKVYYSYLDIHKMCQNSCREIETKFNADVILAIGGGGLIPARMARTVLKKPIYVVSLSVYDKNDNLLETPKVVQWLDFSMFSKDTKFLIIDEVDDTRKTLSFLLNKLKNEEHINGANIGVFVLHNKKKDKFITNEDLNINLYYAGKEIEDKWIVYPWDRTYCKKTLL